MLECRQTECEKLERLLTGGGRNRFPECVFVQGAPQSGKKSVVSAVLRSKSCGSWRVSMSSCHLASLGTSVLFQDILAQLFDEKKNKEDEKAENVANFAEFVGKLRRRLKGSSGSKPVVIALSDVQQLRHCDFNLLPGLQRLQSLTGFKNKLCVVFISNLPWKKWEMEALSFSPAVTLTLAPYTKQQKVQLLTKHLAQRTPRSKELGKALEGDDEEEAFFYDFSEMILGTFHAVCRSLPQFVGVAKMVLPKYIQPVEAGTVEASNSRKLYRNVEPFVKECLVTANLKESSSASGTGSSDVITQNRLSVELPFFSKYLLIAAFLASYNPVSSDKRFFMKSGGGKIKKVRNTVTAAARIAAHKRASQLGGPKMFPMDRMLAIFYVIVDDQGVSCSADILSQIATLVNLGLLTQSGNWSSLDSGLDAPKFKCNVSTDFIRLVSKNVRFEIHNYMYDLQSQ